MDSATARAIRKTAYHAYFGQCIIRNIKPDDRAARRNYQTFKRAYYEGFWRP